MAENVLGVLFQDIADAIRAKTGGTDTMKPNEFPTQIANIPVGGGSSADVRYVTFVGADGTVLYKKAVAVGDDCVDVVTKGLISTPTKESTVAEVYTYSGWSLTEGGAASSSALASVTEDRTVYAAFTASERLYTITYYYDDKSKTEQLPYGAMPSFVPTKSGYMFMGYDPELAAVTGDASYTAIFEVAQNFANATWDYISRVSKSGQASSVFKVGDERTETLTWSDGTTEEITLQIGSIYNTQTEDGTGVMTLVPKKLLSKPSKWGNDYRYTHVWGTGAGNLKPFLEETVLTGLSNELQAVLQAAEASNGLDSSVSLAGYFRISPLHFSDVGMTSQGENAASANSNVLYGFSNTAASRIRYTPDGTAQKWWIGALVTNFNSSVSTSYATYVSSSGQKGYVSGLNTSTYVLFKIFV